MRNAQFQISALVPRLQGSVYLLDPAALGWLLRSSAGSNFKAVNDHITSRSNLLLEDNAKATRSLCVK
ncbi:hypothetical protein VTN31DRAFT_2425 [Thermomyces dupontii]|uniref:uncharacterized protein n=1 Tax=Talaromyces thermophilus TaxID=28565 RepID=UPI003744A719